MRYNLVSGGHVNIYRSGDLVELVYHTVNGEVAATVRRCTRTQDGEAYVRAVQRASR